jgi:hypothetical protein
MLMAYSRKFLLLLLLALLMSSCYRQHFLNHYEDIRMTSSMMILEAQGDTVPFTINVDIPKHLLSGGLVLNLTPCLKKDSLKTPFTLYHCKKGESPDAIKISGSKGGKYTINGYFMNFNQFRNSDLVVEMSADYQEKTAQLSERLLGYGISQIRNVSKPVMTLPEHIDADQVLKDLSARPQTPLCLYLQAIMHARKYDESSLQSSLAKAIAADAALKMQALNDVEFIGYHREKWFTDLCK